MAADGHVVHCTFAARICALTSPTEQRMLAEAMLAQRNRVTIDDVRVHFQETLRSAAARTIATAPADQWMTPDAQQPSSSTPGEQTNATTTHLREALLSASRAVAFTSGVELLAPFDLTVDSPTLIQARIEARQQHTLERHARRRAEIMQAVLAAGDDPAALPPLPDIADEEAHLLHLATLLDIQAMRHPRATLHAIAGRMLLSIDITADEVAPPRQLALPDDVGAFRSINLVHHNNAKHVLLGGQRGLLLFHPHYPSEFVAYVHPAIQTQMGFNAAVRWRDHLWATHSELGLIGWSIHHPDAPAHAIAINTLTAPPRHLTILNDHRLLFIAGTAIHTLADDATVTRIDDLPAPALAIDHRDGFVCILRADGALEQRNPRSLDLIHVQPPSPDTLQGAILHCLYHPLRLLARPTGEIHLRSDIPAAVRTYASGHRDLRLLRAAPAHIAALSADRTRVVIWSIRAAQPMADLLLAAMAQHRIADIVWS